MVVAVRKGRLEARDAVAGVDPFDEAVKSTRVSSAR